MSNQAWFYAALVSCMIYGILLALVATSWPWQAVVSAIVVFAVVGAFVMGIVDGGK